MNSHPHAARSFSAGPIACGFLGVVLGLSLASAQTLPLEEEDSAEGLQEETGFLAGSLLPDGSILKDVLLPSYNEGTLELKSTVKADRLEIVDRGKINATNLLIQMFDSKGEPDARIALKKARFLRAKEILISDDPVSIVAKKLTADGAGLVFDTGKSRGFLRGPVKAVTEIDTRTSMNARPARNALAAGALLMASAVGAPAQEKKEPTAAERFAELQLKPAQLEEVAAEAASRKPQLQEAAGGAEASLEMVKEQSEEARITMNGFFRAAALTSMMAEPAPSTGADVPLPSLSEDPLKTMITSKDGAYFDSAAGLAIFLAQVEVKNPEFQLKGADELKIFMNPQKAEDDRVKSGEKNADGTDRLKPDPKPGPNVEKKEPTPEMIEKMIKAKKDADKLGASGQGGDFGDVKRLVATGVVEIHYQSKDPKEQPLMASARTVVYDIEKEQIILQGGSPWIVREGKLTRANGANAYILIFTKNGEPTKFVTGNQESFQTEFSAPQQEDQKKKEKGATKDQKPKNR